jgi:Zn-dependent M28 family amino/carboxypeptidase
VKAWITEEGARRLAGLSGRELERLLAAARRPDFRPLALGVKTSIRLESRVRRYRTANVLGVLTGRDPALRAEYVIFSAHHDHLGLRAGGDAADHIYNGALDNASGIAEMLAIARAFRALPERPRRSLLFIAFAAEEQNLLGSESYARHPTVAPGRMAANLNFDGANIWGPTKDVSLIGYGKTTLDEVVRAAAKRQGRVVVDDTFPEKGTFYRSDQLHFAKIGTPAIFLRPGVRVRGRPKGWGREQQEAWIERHYHQPSDEYDPSWDLRGLVEDARLAFAVGRAIADADLMPAWTPGDEFAAAREAAIRALPR